MGLFGIVTSKRMGDDPCFGKLVGERGIVSASVVKGRDARPQVTDAPLLQREQFTFVHEGAIDDIAVIRRRISPRRAFQIASKAHAESLFAYVLTHVDAGENTDAALLRAVNDIASSGVRGDFTFLLAAGGSLYAYCAGSPIGLVVRSDSVLVSSETFTDELWRELSNGGLLRIDGGLAVAWSVLAGTIQNVPSEPELPFTD